MIRAVYPGSFDPITLGHCDIIRRIRPMFSELTVLVSHNSTKNYLFSADERLELVKKSLVNIPDLKFDIGTGLTVDYARENEMQVIVRSLRAVSDFEYEMSMANTNHLLNEKIETMLVFASPEYYHVASTFVRDIARHNGDLEKFVPAPVSIALRKKFKS